MRSTRLDGVEGCGTDYLGVARELGAVTTLKKPFDPAELSKVVRELTA